MQVGHRRRRERGVRKRAQRRRARVVRRHVWVGVRERLTVGERDSREGLA